MLTTKEYMREVTAIEPKWLTEAAPTFFKVADANTISKRKRGEKIQPLYNKYEKPNEWRLSRVKRHQRVSQTFGNYYLFVSTKKVILLTLQTL